MTQKLTGPSDISQNVDSGPVQPKILFPSHKISGLYRKFKSDKYEEFKWIEYSASNDAIYCYHCRHFSKIESGPWKSIGFRSWNKMYGKNRTFNKLLMHELSDGHAEAMAAYLSFTKIKSFESSQPSVLSMLSDARAKEIRDNRHYLRTVCETLRITAQMKTAQRETGRYHRDEAVDKDSLYYGPHCGNFLTILSAIANHDPVIADRIRKGPNNAKYTHHSVQNALLKIMSDMILEELQKEIKSSRYFAVMADETCDLTKQEVLAVCLRYFHEGAVHEEFVGISEMEALDAKTLKDKILSILSGMQLDLHLLVGQGYDGAAVVSGHLNGVNALIKREAPFAQYIHCHGHRLNLVVVDVVKNIKLVYECFSLLQSLYKFMSCSSIHPLWISLQETKGMKILQLKAISDTRWSSQADMLRVVCDRLSVIVEVLDCVIAHHKNSSRAYEAKCLKRQLNQELIFVILFLNKVFAPLKMTSMFLQNPQSDLSKANAIIDTVRGKLIEIRDQEVGEVWQNSLKLRDDLNLPHKGDYRTARTHALPDRFLHADYQQVSYLPPNLTSAEDYEKLGRDVIDHIMVEMDRRFDKKNIEIMKAVSALSPEYSSFLQIEELFPFCDIFAIDAKELKTEIQTCRQLLQKVKPDDKPKTLLEFCNFLANYGLCFEQLRNCVLICVTLPVSSCECERSFSTHRMVKNYLRSSMKNQRLESLLMLAIHKNRAQYLNLNRVLDRFSRKFPKCRIALA